MSTRNSAGPLLWALLVCYLVRTSSGQKYFWTQEVSGSTTATSLLPFSGAVTALLTLTDGGASALTFGGLVESSAGSSLFLSQDVWRYTFATQAWAVQLPASQEPPNRAFAIGYELKTPAGGTSLVVIGGLCTPVTTTLAGPFPASGAPCTDLVWAYAPTSRVWTQLAPTGTAPAARYGHAGASDGGSLVYFLGGTTGSGGAAGDAALMATLWCLDYTSSTLVWRAYPTTLAASSLSGYSLRPRWGAAGAKNGTLLSGGTLYVFGGIVGDNADATKQTVTAELLAITVAGGAAAIKPLTGTSGAWTGAPRALATAHLYTSGGVTYLVIAMGYGRAAAGGASDADTVSLASLDLSSTAVTWSPITPTGPAALPPVRQSHGAVVRTSADGAMTLLTILGGRGCTSSGAAGSAVADYSTGVTGPSPACVSSSTSLAVYSDVWDIDLRAGNVARGSVTLVATNDIPAGITRLLLYSVDPPSGAAFVAARYTVTGAVLPLTVSNIPVGTVYAAALDSNGTARAAAAGTVTSSTTPAVLSLLFYVAVPWAVTVVREDGYTPFPGVTVSLAGDDVDAGTWTTGVAGGVTDGAGAVTFSTAPNFLPQDAAVVGFRATYSVTFVVAASGATAAPAVSVVVAPPGAAATATLPARLVVSGTPVVVTSTLTTLGSRMSLTATSGAAGTATVVVSSLQTAYVDVTVTLYPADAGDYLALTATATTLTAAVGVFATLGAGKLPGPLPGTPLQSSGLGGAGGALNMSYLLSPSGRTSPAAAGTTVVVAVAVSSLSPTSTSLSIAFTASVVPSLASTPPVASIPARPPPPVGATGLAPSTASPTSSSPPSAAVALAAGLGAGLGGGLLLTALAAAWWWLRRRAATSPTDGVTSDDIEARRVAREAALRAAARDAVLGSTTPSAVLARVTTRELAAKVDAHLESTANKTRALAAKLAAPPPGGAAAAVVAAAKGSLAAVVRSPGSPPRSSPTGSALHLSGLSKPGSKPGSGVTSGVASGAATPPSRVDALGSPPPRTLAMPYFMRASVTERQRREGSAGEAGMRAGGALPGHAHLSTSGPTSAGPGSGYASPGRVGGRSGTESVPRGVGEAASAAAAADPRVLRQALVAVERAKMPAEDRVATSSHVVLPDVQPGVLKAKATLKIDGFLGKLRDM